MQCQPQLRYHYQPARSRLPRWLGHCLHRVWAWL